MGFLYLTHEDVHLQTHGDTIRRPDLGPPWSSSTTRSRASAVSRWLGRLLRVEPLPARTAEQRQPLTQAADDLNVGAGYTRALAVRVVEELDSTILFGPRGGSVGHVIDAAQRLELEDLGCPLGRRRPGF